MQNKMLQLNKHLKDSFVFFFIRLQVRNKVQASLQIKTVHFKSHRKLHRLIQYHIPQPLQYAY